jgi:hypothetical protein
VLAINSAIDQPTSPRPRGPRAALALLSVLFVVICVLQLPLLEVGMADNTDFLSRAGSVTSGPTASEVSRAELVSHPERRYGDYWIREWQLEQHWQRPRSSTLLLWHLAALSSRALGGDILDLATIGLVLRLASVLLALGLVYALSRAAQLPPWHALVLGVGVCALQLDVEVACHQASFYESAGFLPFLYAMSILLVRVWRCRYRIALGSLAWASCVCAGCVQPQCLPLVLIGGFAILWATVRRRGKRPRRWTVALCVLVPSLLTVVCFAMVRPKWRRENQFNSTFFGALTYSADPGRHLQALGLPAQTRALIGRHAWEDVGQEFISGVHRDELGYHLPLLVYLREPRALCAAMAAVGDAMHGPVPLGRTRFDPGTQAAAPGPEQRAGSAVFAGSQSWARCLPSGGWLWGLMAAAGGLCLWSLRQRPETGSLPGLALVYLASGMASAGVAFLGDGNYELSRHLIYGRVLCDLGLLLSALAAVRLVVRARVGARRPGG